MTVAINATDSLRMSNPLKSELPRQRATQRIAGQGDAIRTSIDGADVILVAEIIIQIFDATHEIAREGIFDAAAN